MRTCGRCDEDKPFEKFKKDKSCPSGRSFTCHSCSYKSNQTSLAFRRETVGLNPELLSRTEKNCYKCKQIKLTTEFHKSKSSSDGLKGICKGCGAKAVAEYKAKDPEKWAQYNRDYWVGFEEELAAKQKAYYEKTKHVVMPCRVASAAKRRSSLLNATPAWADLKAIRKIYVDCHNLSLATGIPHEVDHEIPLVSKLVCGLHVLANLKIITKVANRKKSNKFTIT